MELVPYTQESDIVLAAKKNLEDRKGLPKLIELNIAAALAFRISRARQEPQWKQNYYVATLIYARRDIGKLLPSILRAKGRHPDPDSNYTKLVELKLHANESSRWQKLASIALAKLDPFVRETKALSFNKAMGLVRLEERVELIKTKIFTGKFQDVCKEFADESIDHILTDPPYPAEFLQEWSDLSEVAGRILKPGGFCICYAGKYHLPEYINRLAAHLEYYWQLILLHKGPPAGIHPVRINTKYKPILVFQKAPRKPQEEYVSDLIQGTGREKDINEWQQGEEEATQIIKRFTNRGETILDPFAGSHTIGVACEKNERNCILIEKTENEKWER